MKYLGRYLGFDLQLPQRVCLTRDKTENILNESSLVTVVIVTVAQQVFTYCKGTLSPALKMWIESMIESESRIKQN